MLILHYLAMNPSTLKITNPPKIDVKEFTKQIMSESFRLSFLNGEKEESVIIPPWAADNENNIYWYLNINTFKKGYLPVLNGNESSNRKSDGIFCPKLHWWSKIFMIFQINPVLQHFSKLNQKGALRTLISNQNNNLNELYILYQ